MIGIAVKMAVLLLLLLLLIVVVLFAGRALVEVLVHARLVVQDFCSSLAHTLLGDLLSLELLLLHVHVLHHVVVVVGVLVVLEWRRVVVPVLVAVMVVMLATASLPTLVVVVFVHDE